MRAMVCQTALVPNGVNRAPQLNSTEVTIPSLFSVCSGGIISVIGWIATGKTKIFAENVFGDVDRVVRRR
jgi:hypothetical protein